MSDLVIQSVDDEFEKELQETVKNLFLAYDEESEKKVKEFVKERYKDGIPIARDLLNAMEDTNYELFHELAHTLLKYKRGDIFCEYDPCRDSSGVIGFDVCNECEDQENCYENVYVNNVQWDFGDQTFPMHLANLLGSVLSDGDLCVYIDNITMLEYPDLASFYDYANSDILNEVYYNLGYKTTIINHAQNVMFEDLMSIEDEGSCFNYGDFILLLDPFKAKNKKEYMIGGE